MAFHKLKAQLDNQRGMMLLVALMVLLALTSVGLTSLHVVNAELGYAGNLRKGSSAFRVTESGAFSAMAYASSLGASAFASRVESEKALQPDGTMKTVWQASDIVSAIPYFDLSASGSFGYEGVVLNEEAASGASPVNFEVRITETGMRQPLPGFSFNGPGARCRFKYQLDTVGSVGTQLSGEPSDAGFVTWQMIRSIIYVGPLPCEQQASGVGSI